MSKIKKKYYIDIFTRKNTLKTIFTTNTTTVFGKREWEKDVEEEKNWKWEFRCKASDPSNASSFISFNPPNFDALAPIAFFFNAF
jgi:hypothetical protein